MREIDRQLKMEKKIYDAALHGNVNILHELLQEDKSILDRVSLNCTNNYTPLHIAAMRGHEEFVKVIVAQSRELSTELDSRQKLSPLHLASARGHSKIVEALVNANPDMCLVLDRNGSNPLHLAAVKGRVEVLEMLVASRPFAAREKTKRGESILHLCVKYNQLDALKKLVEIVDDEEFLNQKDGDGLSILHLAVISKQIQIVQYLITTAININEKNPKGRTAMDLIPQNPPEMNQQIEEVLQQVGALKAEEITESITNVTDATRPNNFSPDDYSQPLRNDTVPAEEHSQMPINIVPAENAPSRVNPSTTTQGANQQSNFRWLEQKSKALMVVASLIATMAFQAGLSPPGAVWQDDSTQDSSGNRAPNPHKAGESVMAYHHLHYYKYFLRFNTTAFVSSLSIILMLISELPFKHEIFMWFLVGVMWLTATSIALTYGISIAYVTPEMDREQLGHVIEIAVAAWCGVITLVLLGKTTYSLHQWWKNGRRIRWPMTKRNSLVRNHGNQPSIASTSFV